MFRFDGFGEWDGGSACGSMFAIYPCVPLFSLRLPGLPVSGPSGNKDVAECFDYCQYA